MHKWTHINTQLKLNHCFTDLWQQSLLLGLHVHLGSLNGSAAPRMWLTNREESSTTSGRSQACAKWSVFPVNLRFLNPVKLRTLPKSRPPDLSHNTKFKKHHASVSVCNVRGRKNGQSWTRNFALQALQENSYSYIYTHSNFLLLCHNMRDEMAV